MTLYHFTRKEYLSSILKHGLDKGDVPLNVRQTVNGVGLTEDGDPSKQGWTTFVPQKRQYRLLVDVDPADRRLLRWTEIPHKLRVDNRFWKLNSAKALGDTAKWWVSFLPIQPSRLLEIFDTVLGRILTAEELQQISQQPETRGCNMWRLRAVPFEQAMRNSFTTGEARGEFFRN